MKQKTPQNRLNRRTGLLQSRIELKKLTAQDVWKTENLDPYWKEKTSESTDVTPAT